MLEIFPSNNDREINELFVFMSIDKEGRHGVVGGVLPILGTMPLVTGSPKVAEFMKTIAKQVAEGSGKPVEMFTFKRGDSTWRCEP